MDATPCNTDFHCSGRSQTQHLGCLTHSREISHPFRQSGLSNLHSEPPDAMPKLAPVHVVHDCVIPHPSIQRHTAMDALNPHIAQTLTLSVAPSKHVPSPHMND